MHVNFVDSFIGQYNSCKTVHKNTRKRVELCLPIISKELDKSYEAKKILNVVKLQIFRKSKNQKKYGWEFTGWE